MPIETTTLRAILQSLGPALKVTNLNFATNACEEIENLKRDDPSMLNSSAYSVTFGTVRIVMVLDEEAGPAFSNWNVYSFFVEKRRPPGSEANS